MTLTGLNDHGLSWLLDRSLLNSVRHLCVSGAGLTGTGLVSLWRSPLRESLVSLFLDWNPLGPVDGLPAPLEFPRLRTLDLNECGLGDLGAARLLRALRTPRLRKLGLGQNDLGNDALRALASNPSLGRLEELTLSFNTRIADEGAAIPRASPHLRRLDRLELLDTGISDRVLTLLRRRFRRVRR